MLWQLFLLSLLPSFIITIHIMGITTVDKDLFSALSCTDFFGSGA
jgi:hypothetical protein